MSTDAGRLRIYASPSVRCFVAQKLLAILCRRSSTQVTEDLRKMLLTFEATGQGYIYYSTIGGAQYPFGAPLPL